MSLAKDDLQATAATEQDTSIERQDASSQLLPVIASPAARSIGAAEAAAMGPPRLQFSEKEYRGQTSALVTVMLTGKNVNEARVTFTAKEASATDERVVARKELVFENGKTSSSFSIEVGPNVSDSAAIVELELSDPQNAELGDPHQATLVVEPTRGPLEYLWNLIGSILSDPSTGRIARHIMLGLILIATITMLDKLVARYADIHQAQWDVYLNPKEKASLTFPAKPMVQDPAKPMLLEHEQIRLKDQLDRIRLKQNFHLSLMEFYYKGYYMGIIILSFTGALAAIALVLISKKGWAATSEYVITTFFIMTCAALFYGSWAGLFKQEENITNNKVLYLKYTALENELLSYVTTGEALRYDISSNDVKTATTASQTPTTEKATQQKGATTPETKSGSPPDPDKGIGIPLPAAAFIHYVDLQLAQDNIAIGFDYSQIPNYKAAFSNLGNSK